MIILSISNFLRISDHYDKNLRYFVSIADYFRLNSLSCFRIMNNGKDRQETPL